VRIAIATALCCVIHQSAWAQSASDPVARHRAAYQLIEGHLEKYQKVQAEREALHLEQRSVEGGWLEAHCDGSELKKIFAEDDGETYTGTTSYYYDHDSLFFIFVRNGHGHMTETSGPYPKRTEFEEERLYFADGKLIRWLGQNNKPHDVTTRASERHGADMLAEGNHYHDLMAGCSPKAETGAPAVDEDMSYTLAGIESEYEQIENELPKYHHIQSGSLEAYCEGKSLRLVLVNAKDWYYFKNDSLFFAYRTSQSGEERYSFDNGKLIRWLGNRNAPHDPKSDEARMAAVRLLATANRLRRSIPECRP
jgi:hypothetical protein